MQDDLLNEITQLTAELEVDLGRPPDPGLLDQHHIPMFGQDPNLLTESHQPEEDIQSQYCQSARSSITEDSQDSQLNLPRTDSHIYDRQGVHMNDDNSDEENDSLFSDDTEDHPELTESVHELPVRRQVGERPQLSRNTGLTEPGQGTSFTVHPNPGIQSNTQVRRHSPTAY